MHKNVEIMTFVLDVILYFCIYMYGMTVSWNVITLISVVAIYIKNLRI